MPVIIKDGRIPARWAQAVKNRMVSFEKGYSRDQAVRVAFINNMPDAALEDTELQFFDLLDGAAQGIPVVVQLFSLTGIPRGERGQEHLNSYYSDFDQLWSGNFDAAIITGTEPHQPNLKDEPYWKLLTEVFDWAGRETVSTILSCLAAHASVLYHDGIGRHRLADKQFGVFESAKAGKHALIDKLPAKVRFPHSRWNEIREADLAAANYCVLTKSKDAGVDSFVYRRPKSLFLHFQGHPEYTAETLFKEYRRDVRRYVRGERERYPSMPQGYFTTGVAKQMRSFQEQALLDRSEALMTSFPEPVFADRRSTWRSAALSIYRQWLEQIVSLRQEQVTFIAVPGMIPAVARKQAAIP